jgi:hypothetical protein
MYGNSYPFPIVAVHQPVSYWTSPERDKGSTPVGAGADFIESSIVEIA